MRQTTLKGGGGEDGETQELGEAGHWGTRPMGGRLGKNESLYNEDWNESRSRSRILKLEGYSDLDDVSIIQEMPAIWISMYELNYLCQYIKSD